MTQIEIIHCTSSLIDGATTSPAKANTATLIAIACTAATSHHGPARIWGWDGLVWDCVDSFVEAKGKI